VSHAQALSGRSLTSTGGTLGNAHVVALSGQRITSAQGTITASGSVTVALTGLSITSGQGTLKPSFSIALNGQKITSGQGTVKPSLAKALSGLAITSARGSVSPALSVKLNGQVITSAQGTVTASVGGNVTVALSGLRATFAQGQIIAVGGGSADAGSRRRRTRYILRVDGQEFVTKDLAEVNAILAQAKKLAQDHARALARAATNLDSRKAPELKLPEISGNKAASAVIEVARREIREIYANALRDAEIAMWIEVARRNDDNEDSLLLLL
jgi:hypothetical protein